MLLSNVLLDPFSPAGVMKLFNLDSSRDGRRKYARDPGDHGIKEEPFSWEWGENMRKDVLWRYGRQDKAAASSC